MHPVSIILCNGFSVGSAAYVLKTFSIFIPKKTHTHLVQEVCDEFLDPINKFLKETNEEIIKQYYLEEVFTLQVVLVISSKLP